MGMPLGASLPSQAPLKLLTTEWDQWLRVDMCSSSWAQKLGLLCLGNKEEDGKVEG